MHAVITDCTPNRCTVASVHDDRDAAELAAERLDTGINGLPALVLEAHGPVEPGERAWHDGSRCWSGNATHWGYGSGMPGCLFDNGPHFAETKEDAIDGALFIFADDLEAEEYEQAERDLYSDGIHYFPAERRSELGASLVQVWEEQGPCPESDE